MIQYTINKQHKIIYATVFGNISVVDIISHFQNILGDPEFSPRLNTIAEIDDDITLPPATPENIVLLQKVLKGYSQRRKGCKWAFVIARESTRALFETGLDLVEALCENVRIFDHVDKAFDWIRIRQ